MIEELAINIRIYDRQYPMKVQPRDEALVRKAAETINNQIKAYQNQFNNIDIQDLLAMVAFNGLVENLQMKKEQEVINENIQSMLQLIDMP